MENVIVAFLWKVSRKAKKKRVNLPYDRDKNMKIIQILIFLYKTYIFCISAR